MKLEGKDIYNEVVGISVIIILLAVLSRVNPNILTRFTDGLYHLSNIIDAETLYLWRERLFDTIFQAVAILVGLISVLILVVWGEKSD